MPQLSRLNILVRVGGLDRSGIGSTVELTSPEPANALIESLRNVIGAADVRPAWLEVGVQLIAVDTLVHNFLHRTGILSRFKAAHPYGPACYRHGGCAYVIRLIASRIDARQFNLPTGFSSVRATRHLGGISAKQASTSATAIGSMTGIAATAAQKWSTELCANK